MANEARELWLECEYDTDPNDIPYAILSHRLQRQAQRPNPQAHSTSFLLDAAERDDVSLDQYIT